MSLGTKKFIFFCGKGGVGKTTCASATAIKLSHLGRKTLLFSTDPAHSIADSLETRVNSKFTEINGVPNLRAIEINASNEFKKFTKKYKKEINDFLKNSSYFDKEDIDDILLLTLPGIDELMAIKKIIDFLELENDFEYFICDTAPTGHALHLLSMPDVVNEWIKLLANMQWKYKYIMNRISNNVVEDNELLIILKRVVTKVKSTLRDPAQTIFNIVTIPESLAVSESKHFNASLNKMGINISNLIINNIIPNSEICEFCRNNRISQNIYIKELEQSFNKINIIEKLRQNSDVKGIDKLNEFSKDLKLSGVECGGK